MAISDTLSSIATNLSNAYDALSAKGATIPAFKNIENLASAIATISAGGGIDEGIEAMLNKSIYTYSNSTRTSIPAYGFYVQSNLSEISLPALTYIDRYGFYGAGLQSVYLPELVSMGSDALAGLSATQIELPKLEYIPESGFIYNWYLQTIIAPSVSYMGKNAFYNNRVLTSVSLPLCTNVGISAFALCYALSSIELPLVEDVGFNAFSNCSALQNVSFPNLTYINGLAFNRCSSLSSISFSNVVDIGEYAFQSCGITTLSNGDLPQCNHLSSGAFENCASLTSVDLPMVGSLVIREEGTEDEYEDYGECGAGAFTNCPQLSQAFLSGLGFVPSSIFMNCPSLTSFEFNNEEVWEIGDQAFENTGLTSVDFDELFPNAEEIGNSIFARCSNLSYFKREDNSISFMDGAFESCSNLSQILITLADCGERTFANTAISFIDDTNFLTIGDIGRSAFKSCPITYINHPEGLFDIGSQAFQNISQLSYFSSPYTYRISMSAFQGCSNLAFVRLTSVQSMAGYAFSGCNKLSVLDLQSCSSIPTIGGGIFNNTPISKSTYLGYYGSIYVPTSLYNDFITNTNWTRYAQRITSAPVPV